MMQKRFAWLLKADAVALDFATRAVWDLRIYGETTHKLRTAERLLGAGVHCALVRDGV